MSFMYLFVILQLLSYTFGENQIPHKGENSIFDIFWWLISLENVWHCCHHSVLSKDEVLLQRQHVWVCDKACLLIEQLLWNWGKKPLCLYRIALSRRDLSNASHSFCPHKGYYFLGYTDSNMSPSWNIIWEMIRLKKKIKPSKCSPPYSKENLSEDSFDLFFIMYMPYICSYKIHI